jgi:aspartate/methionine/tyrosine aminotransferase
MVTLPLTNLIRPEAAQVRQSGIVELFNYGRGRDGLIPLWVGEGDLPTPRFICEAAERSLAAGETFYTAQRGHPDFRAAIATYMNLHYGERLRFSPEQFFVTTGGMHALQIAMRLVAGLGDEVIVPVPAWPNFEAALTIAGATTVGAALVA